MSELKVVSQSDVMWIPWYRKYYYNTEADRVITHHKYKRCLAMAKWCMSEYLHCDTNSSSDNIANIDKKLQELDNSTAEKAKEK